MQDREYHSEEAYQINLIVNRVKGFRQIKKYTQCYLIIIKSRRNFVF